MGSGSLTRGDSHRPADAGTERYAGDAGKQVDVVGAARAAEAAERRRQLRNQTSLQKGLDWLQYRRWQEIPLAPFQVAIDK